MNFDLLTYQELKEIADAIGIRLGEETKTDQP